MACGPASVDCTMSYAALRRLNQLCQDASANGKAEVWVAIKSTDPKVFEGPFDSAAEAQAAAATFGTDGRAWGPFCAAPGVGAGGVAGPGLGLVCVHLPGSSRSCQRPFIPVPAGADVTALFDHLGIPAAARTALAQIFADPAQLDHREFAASVIRAMFFDPAVPSAVVEDRYAVIIELVNLFLTSSKKPDSVFLTSAAAALMLLPYYVAAGDHEEARDLRADLGLP